MYAEPVLFKLSEMVIVKPKVLRLLEPPRVGCQELVQRG